GTAPVAHAVLGADYIGAGDVMASTFAGTIPAFDGTADRNGDNYLDDAEWAGADQANRTARFRYQSRLFYGHTPTDGNYGPMRFSTNPAGADFVHWAADYFTRLLNRTDYAQRLADGLFLDNSSGKPPVADSTRLAEPVSSYARDYGELLHALGQALAPRWILANTTEGSDFADEVIANTPAQFKERSLKPLAVNWTAFEALAATVARQSALPGAGN